MNRLIAPALLVIVLTLSGTANAAPKDANTYATEFFAELARNGN